jgi:hypothetical protein
MVPAPGPSRAVTMARIARAVPEAMLLPDEEPAQEVGRVLLGTNGVLRLAQKCEGFLFCLVFVSREAKYRGQDLFNCCEHLSNATIQY